MYQQLTRRQIQILRTMRDTDEELVYSKGEAYVGNEHVAPRTVFALVRAMAVSMDQFSEVGKVERYTINETGRTILTAPPSSMKARAIEQTGITLQHENGEPQETAETITERWRPRRHLKTTVALLDRKGIEHTQRPVGVGTMLQVPGMFTAWYDPAGIFLFSRAPGQEHTVIKPDLNFRNEEEQGR